MNDSFVVVIAFVNDWFVVVIDFEITILVKILNLENLASVHGSRRANFLSSRRDNTNTHICPQMDSPSWETGTKNSFQLELNKKYVHFETKTILW